ncbi:hypothetical protein, partial [Streptomyces sp. NPDC005890]|uniref:hypothetical protein n=1 Tax=Streptomyces sp. NPDC005890 TaxID=3154568 RepID=UPI0033F42D74
AGGVVRLARMVPYGCRRRVRVASCRANSPSASAGSAVRLARATGSAPAGPTHRRRAQVLPCG